MPLSVAPVTGSPASFSTGIGSPVSIDSSTDERPSTHHAVHRHLLARPHPQPVADRDLLERRPPPRARPARSTRAVLAARPSSARIAEPVRSRAPSSRTWPSSTSTTITAAASK